MKNLLLLISSLLISSTIFARGIDERVLEALDQTSPLELTKITKLSKRIGIPQNYEAYDCFALTPEKREVRFYYYRNSNKAIKRPLILVMPPIGGVTPMELILAAYFTQAGYNVVTSLISADVGDLNREPEDMEKMFLETNSDTRGVLRLIAERPENDPTRIGAIGTSLGGIRLSMMLAVEEKIKAASLIVAGADIPEIMATSTQGTVKKYREFKMKERGLKSVQEYQELLASHMEIDPLITAKFINKDKLLLFRSVKDKDVPTKNQYELWEALGRPESHEIKLSHIPAAGYAALFKSPKISKFFKEKFN